MDYNTPQIQPYESSLSIPEIVQESSCSSTSKSVESSEYASTRSTSQGTASGQTTYRPKGIPAGMAPVEFEDDFDMWQHLKDNYLPVLPKCIAITLCVMNFIVPGLGTLFVGLLRCCKCKNIGVFPTEEDRSACYYFLMALLQILLVPFFLIGWCWSGYWGVAMCKLSGKPYSQTESKSSKKYEFR